MLGAREDVAAWLGFSATGPALPPAPPSRREPPLTDQAKRKILGGNLARLHGIDVEAKSKELGLSL